MKRVVIIGSFRKHLVEIGEIMTEFAKYGHEIFAPKSVEAVNSGAPFIVLKTDDATKTPLRLEQEYTAAMHGADLIYLANIDGYIGQSTAAELSLAFQCNWRVVRHDPRIILSPDTDELARETLLPLIEQHAPHVPIKAITPTARQKIKLSEEQLTILSNCIETYLKTL